MRRATIDFVVEKALTLTTVTIAGPLVIFFATRALAALGTLTWLVILGATAAGIVVGQRRYGWQRRIYRYHYPKVSFRYEVLSYKICYRITEGGRLRYSRQISVRALRDLHVRGRLATEGDEPVDRITDRPAIGRLQRSAESLVAFDAKPHFFNEGVVRWRVDKPFLYHHYLLHWSWKSEAAMISMAATIASGGEPGGGEDGGPLRVA